MIARYGSRHGERPRHRVAGGIDPVVGRGGHEGRSVLAIQCVGICRRRGQIGAQGIAHGDDPFTRRQVLVVNPHIEPDRIPIKNRNRNQVSGIIPDQCRIDAAGIRCHGVGVAEPAAQLGAAGLGVPEGECDLNRRRDGLARRIGQASLVIDQPRRGHCRNDEGRHAGKNQPKHKRFHFFALLLRE